MNIENIVEGVNIDRKHCLDVETAFRIREEYNDSQLNMISAAFKYGYMQGQKALKKTEDTK